MKLFQERVRRLSSHSPAVPLRGGLRGVERETLRVSPDGFIARTGHPVSLGSALTNAHITTDYSEALLEFVTPPQRFNWSTLQFLCDIHQFVHESIGAELLWPLSMPCQVRSEEDVPIARYGTSNIGLIKHIYRRGLGHRYGRIMQAIAGIHFNYSLPDDFWPVYREIEGASLPENEFRSAAYMGLVRNVRRSGWLLLYLYGASPAVCKSFLQGNPGGLEELDAGTAYGRYATSLRMSDLGYRNSNQADLHVSANSLETYITDLVRATHTPKSEFTTIGLKANGEYRQLSVNQLQVENEYYSTVRPKRVARRGERASAALRRGGVEYVELRALDVSPFDPVGVNQRQLRFLEVFLIYCLLADSPVIAPAERAQIDENNLVVARRGRDPELRLKRAGSEVRLADWAAEICEGVRVVAELLDGAGETDYVAIVAEQAEAARNPALTPSARLLADLRQTGQPLAAYGLELASSNRDYFLSLAPELNRHRTLLCEEALSSVQRQVELEAGDQLEFDEYLVRYLA